jgi:hypothetical protein
MKKKMKKLRLSKETLRGLDLRHATGAAPTARCQNPTDLCQYTDMSICLTVCPTCGDTNYETCISNATNCTLC